MPTKYEAKVDALKERILGALTDHTDPDAASFAILEAAAPEAVSRTDPAAPTVTRPPSAAESALLSNAAVATVLELSHRATAAADPLPALRLGATPALPLLVDAALSLASRAPPACDPALPSSCIEVALEAATNAEAAGVMAYLDSRLAAFKRPGVMPKSHHTLLRTCTLLLKRLSKSQDAALCGGVLMFLAKFLPLTERSGVNLTGAFHTDNVTPVEDVPEGALDAEGRPVDAKFYKTFWGLQRWFADPPAALAQGRWADISRGVRTVLDRFAKVKVTVTDSAARGSEAGGAGDGTVGAAAQADATSVKYLSSARLLPLQLRDAAFRRHFLIQALVLMAWVERPALKDWADKGAKGRALEDLEDLRNRVLAALEATPERGAEFAAAVRGVLAGEAAWAAWKQAGCPPEPLQVAPAELPSNIDETAPLGPPRKRPKPSPDAIYGVHMGMPELDRLWNLTEDNTSTLGADDRGGFKSLRQMMEPVIEEMNEEAAGEGGELDDSMRASKNAAYSWKTLRLVARDSLPAFAKAVRASGDLTVAARELYPDEVPPLPEEPAGAAGEVVEEEKKEGEDKGAEEGGATDGELGGSRPDTPADTLGAGPTPSGDVEAGEPGEGGEEGEEAEGEGAVEAAAGEASEQEQGAAARGASEGVSEEEGDDDAREPERGDGGAGEEGEEGETAAMDVEAAEGHGRRDDEERRGSEEEEEEGAL